jgi:hypothetical protein
MITNNLKSIFIETLVVSILKHWFQVELLSSI